ncbi:polysaccharide deacetylase family protein [Bacillus smithii]|uniref:polysaccharide deacetylase family protein n=1 Tax=Bacillus smithii TaxID=1479 RepID=UPI003D1F7A36
MAKLRRIFGILFLCMLSFFIVDNPMTTQYLSSLKTESLSADAKVEPSLYNQIKAADHKYSRKAQDAVIDRVWKKIPGYNGIKVDVKRSYERMKKDGKFNEDKLVFHQTKPQVHLHNLPPAPIYRGHPDKPMVSFAVNVAWGNEYLPKILSVLKKHHIHVAFFLEGRWVKKNPDLAKMIVDGGHEVGNHSFTHPDMKTLSSDRIREEMIKTNQVIEATTGKNVSLFAPPSGSYRDEVVKIADSLGMETIMWTVDTIDWRNPAPDELVNRVISNVGPGSIVLMHPTKSTAASLERLITKIQKKNLKINTVSQLLDEERIFPIEDEKND